MITYAIGAEKVGEKLVYVNNMRDAYPFPEGICVGKFKSAAKAHRYKDKHEERLYKLLNKKGYSDYELSVIRIDAPHVLKSTVCF